MKFKKVLSILGLTLGAVIGGYALAQPVINVLPSIGATDLFIDIPGGFPSAQTQTVTGATLGNLAPTYPGNNPENALIGGDATTNLFQRATTGASQTTTIAYGGPDRWAYWSGASTAMTVSRDTTAADLAVGFQAAFKMARTSGQTGVVQMCMMQEVETVNSLIFQGQTAEISFSAVTGANYSPASNNLSVVLITGTGTDEGISKAAFNFNGGGGGSSTWTGQVNTSVTVPLANTTTASRYGAVIPVPKTATEIAVALCMTPVGTAGTNDYVALSGIQLTRNNALTTLAGTAGAALQANDVRLKAFAARSQATETVLQQRYFYKITESTTTIFQRAMCAVSTTSLAVCQIKFPVTMRIAPAMTYTSGFTLTGSAQSSVTACTVTRTSTTLASAAVSTEAVPIDCTSAAAFGAAGTAAQLYDIGTGAATGVINANADL